MTLFSLAVRFKIEAEGHGPRELSRTVIGSGFEEKTDPNALVIGPTGLGLGENGTLYVADTLQSRIAAIPGAIFRNATAGTGDTVSQGKRSTGRSGWPLRRTITS
jgi:hypothetical protein